MQQETSLAHSRRAPPAHWTTMAVKARLLGHFYNSCCRFCLDSLCAVWTLYVDNLICTKRGEFDNSPLFFFFFKRKVAASFCFCLYVSGQISMCFWHVDTISLCYLCFGIKIAGFKQCISLFFLPFFFGLYVSGHRFMWFQYVDAVFLWYFVLL